MTFDAIDPDDLRRGDKALVIKPLLRSEHTHRDSAAMLEEAVGLARAIALDVVESMILNVAHPTPATLIGKGQVEQCKTLIESAGIALVVMDHMLSPVQQRNLERQWKCKVIDRTGLILEIFGERARTREGQLQVELAALDYQKSRLVRSWTHLERQRGGYGFLGGPGESQLELDRRLITARLVKLKAELQQVRRTRGLQRDQRQRAGHPTIALVGYTNAGKSTLFNRLTGAEVLAKDMLFATLDPTMRGIKLPGGREAIVSDTVGFISDLPTHLVEAFRATLEEVQLADVILHVRDVSHPETAAQRDAVTEVLASLDIAPDDDRLIEVLNKIDLMPEEERRRMKDYAARISGEVGMLADRMNQSGGESGGFPLPLRERKQKPGLSSAEGGSKSLVFAGEGVISKGAGTPSPAKSKGLLEQAQDFASSPSRGEEIHSASSAVLSGLRPEAKGGMTGISALTGEGIPELLKLLEERLSAQSQVYDIDVPLADGAALSWLHAHGKIIGKRDTKTKSRLRVEMDAADYGRYRSRFGKSG